MEGRIGVSSGGHEVASLHRENAKGLVNLQPAGCLKEASLQETENRHVSSYKLTL